MQKLDQNASNDSQSEISGSKRTRPLTAKQGKKGEE